MANMNRDPESEFQMRLVALAGMVRGFVLSPQIIELYHRLLEPMGFENVNRALDQILMERGSNDPFPSIKEITKLLNNELDPESHAIDIAGKIMQALPKYGSDDLGVQRAKALIGPIGWKVVEAEGGWRHLIENTKNDQVPILKSQWRKQALVEIMKSKHQQPDAPRIENKENIEKVRQLLHLPKLPEESK